MTKENIPSQSDVEKQLEDWTIRISTLYANIKEWTKSNTSYTIKEQSEVTMYEELMDKHE